MKKSIKLIIITAFLIFNCTNYFAQEKKFREISDIGPQTETIELGKYSLIYYISAKLGSDEEGDGSKDSPYANIDYALKKVAINSEKNVVALFIAEGTYAGRTIEMKSYVDMYGGFSPENWKRDIYKFSTFLDGQKNRRVLIGASNARIDGLTITNGLSRTHGGGILCDDTSPTISNCFITNNYVLEPEDFNYTRIHQQGHHGGGIACRYNAVPVIRNNIFYGNETSIGNGAAISFYGWLRMEGAPDRNIVDNFMQGGWTPVVKDNVFIHNVSGINDTGRTRSSNGAAISCSSEARPVIENNVVVCNQAKGRSDAGGIYSENFSYPVINGNWILGNICDDDGGGIYTNHTGHAIITNNFIAGNWTIGNGAGGVRISKEARASISDNIIVQNQTGGGVHSVDGYIELKNNIIMDNKGSASIRYTNLFSYFQPSIIENNIVRDNEGVIVVSTAYNGQVVIQNNNISKREYPEGNYDQAVQLGDGEIVGEIVSAKFNCKTYQTMIETDKLREEELIGRVIRVGDFWSVITKVEKKKIFVWGDVNRRSSDKSSFMIISDYKK
ncbi:right-handed parallel beta-helix repeat-containing protein [Bacteroidota bacterium]